MTLQSLRRRRAAAWRLTRCGLREARSACARETHAPATQAERLLVSGSFAEAAEAAQRVLALTRAPAREEEEGEDVSLAAAAVLLQARRFLGDSPAQLRALLEAQFVALHAVPPEALLLWCARFAQTPLHCSPACAAARLCGVACVAPHRLTRSPVLAGRGWRSRRARRRLRAPLSWRRSLTVRPPAERPPAPRIAR